MKPKRERRKTVVDDLYKKLRDDRESFWTAVYPLYMQAIQTTQMQLQAQVESIARDKDRKLMLERLYNDAVNDLRLLQSTPTATTPGSQGLTAESLPAGASSRQRLEAARADLARLEMRLKPEHPDVLRAKRIIADLEAKVAAEPATPTTASNQTTTVGRTPDEQQRRERVQNMKAEIESLDRQIQFKESDEIRLRGQIGSFQGRIAAVPAVESEFTALTRDYQTVQETYKSLLSKSEESKVAKNLELRQISEQFKVLDSPRVPDRPIGARRIQVNGVGILGGLLLGLAMERINQREGQPAIFYLHPWEIDPGQPRLATSRVTAFRHYCNLHKTEERLTRLLRHFRFAPLADVLATAQGQPELAAVRAPVAVPASSAPAPQAHS